MKEEDELLKKYGCRNPFTVPEGYFEHFQEELMNQLPEKPLMPEAVQPNLWLRIKPWIYLAAMFCGLLAGIRVIVNPSTQETPTLTVTEVESLPDEYIESILDQSIIDDYALYQYLTDADTDLYN